MGTIFNASLRLEEYVDKWGPKDAYEATADFLEEKGFLGDFHVNHYGLVRKGLDKTCETNRTGEFCIHYRNPNDDETIREKYEAARIRTSGFDNLGMEILDMAKGMVNFLEKADPTSRILPAVDICSRVPESIGINTPAGRQSLHYHMNDSLHFGIMQLFKPKKEKDYYCLDILKDCVFGLTNYELSIREKLAWDEISKKEERELKKKLKVMEKISPRDLFGKFIGDVDGIIRVPRELKRIGELEPSDI
jgi:hypothetical protein